MKTIATLISAAVLVGVLGTMTYSADNSSVQKLRTQADLNKYKYMTKRRTRRLVGGNTRILNYAKANMGQTIGGGQCTDFVQAALEAANRKAPDYSDYRNYIWGRQLAPGERMLAGDIVQFEECEFKSPDGYTWTAPHHTAIILREFGNGNVNGTRLVLIHQNDGAQVVSQREIDLNHKTKGSVKVFRAVPKNP